MTRKRTITLLGLMVLSALVFYLSDPGRFYETHGVDVSHHQGPIDWGTFADDGTAFAYIKATEGGDWIDTRFAENWEAARQAGIPRGAYHFFTLCRPGADQARNLLDTLPASPEMLPVAVDLEFGGNCSARPSAAEFRTELDTFLSTVEKATGMRLVAYTTVDFYRHYLEDAPPDVIWWVRSVVVPPLSGPEWTIWQYYPFYRSGVDGPVDRNVLRGTVDELRAAAQDG